ncbi:MAG: tripartite tricarboxylate transporter substrate binding protein [Proteobacteria bacterium]|nr:tripartite tricarboxylate transporter substrate binding protein [Pseudomonadota bacterium]
MFRKVLLAALVATSTAALVAPLVHAQSYPTKPVRMIVGFPPGGGTDVVARVLSQRMSEMYGQTFVVENRAGATGTIGADVLAKSPADGYTLMMGHANSHAIAPNLMSKLPYDPIKDFAPVAYVGYVPNVLSLHPSVPAKSMKELVALLKNNPAKYTYASSGNGSSQHLSGEMFKLLTGTNVLHVPYKGSGDAIKDLIAGTVSMNFDTMPPVLEHIKAGKLRGLGISTPKRLAQLPDVPTFAEEGLTGFEILNWYGVMAPAATPKDIVMKLATDMNKAMREPEVKARLEQVGTQLKELSPDEFGAFMRAELAKYAKLVKEANIRLE